MTWHRRLLAAGLLAASVAFAIQALSPTPTPGVPILVAAHDLTGGRLLTAGDVQLRELPPRAVPAGALGERADAVGGTLVAPVRAGEVLADVRLLDRSFLDGYGPGRVAAPVRIADPASVSLLRPGDVVDVLAAGAQAQGTAASAARLVASAVRVVTIPPVARSPLGAAEVDGALLVVVTTSETAARLAAAAVTDRLSLVVRGE